MNCFNFYLRTSGGILPGWGPWVQCRGQRGCLRSRAWSGRWRQSSQWPPLLSGRKLGWQHSDQRRWQVLLNDKINKWIFFWYSSLPTVYASTTVNAARRIKLIGVSFLLMCKAIKSPMERKNAGKRKTGLLCKRHHVKGNLDKLVQCVVTWTNSLTPGVKRKTPPIKVVIDSWTANNP